MKTIFLIAESASVNADNTFSLTRGGINRTIAHREPNSAFDGALLVFLEGEPGDADRSVSADFKCVAPNGTAVFESGEIEAKLPGAGRNSHIVVKCHCPIMNPGVYKFQAHIDGVDMGSELTVEDSIEEHNDERERKKNIESAMDLDADKLLELMDRLREYRIAGERAERAEE